MFCVPCSWVRSVVWPRLYIFKIKIFTTLSRSPDLLLSLFSLVCWWGPVGLQDHRTRVCILHPVFVNSIFFKVLFIYLWETCRKRQRHRQREKLAPCGEPDVGLNPRMLGSWPEPKGDAHPLSHPGVPVNNIIATQLMSICLCVV